MCTNQLNTGVYICMCGWIWNFRFFECGAKTCPTLFKRGRLGPNRVGLWLENHFAKGTKLVKNYGTREITRLDIMAYLDPASNPGQDTKVEWYKLHFYSYDDFDVGIHGFQCHCTSRNESTAPYRYDHCIYVWYLLNDFKTHSSLASNNVWMVIPRNIFANDLDIQNS